MNNFNLFGIGPMELIFVLIIALVVMGPERLPQVAREMAKMMAQVREIYTELMGTLTKEFGDMEELKEIQRDLNSLRDPLNLNKFGKTPSKSSAKAPSSTPKRSTAEQVAQSSAAATSAKETSQPLSPSSGSTTPLAPAPPAVSAAQGNANFGEENRIAPPQSEESSQKAHADGQAKPAPVISGDES